MKPPSRRLFKNCSPFRKRVACLILFSYMWWTYVAWGSGKGEDFSLGSSHTSTPLKTARSTRSLEDYKRNFQVENGIWSITEVGVLLQASGNIQIRDLTIDKNICILTDGDVTFQGRSRLAHNAAIQARRISMPGDVQAQGYVRLWGDELEINSHKSLRAEKGAQLMLKILSNRGVFSAFGAGLSGTIEEWINEGKTDLASAHLVVQKIMNETQGIFRTQGSFLFTGDTFENRGTIFTAGIHQLTLTNAYDDWGHLYTSSLFLLNAPRIEFHSTHGWLREAVINASTYLEVSRGSHFNFRSDQAKCFLQLSSQGDLHYHGETTQCSDSFPFTAYDEIWTAPSKSIFLGKQSSRATSHPLAQTPFSLAPWDRLRPRDDGVVFHTDSNALDLGGTVSLTAGSVKKSVKGKLEADGLQLKAGYFTGDSVRVLSQNAFLNNTQFEALRGRIELVVAEQARLQNTQLFGGESTTLMTQTLTLKDESLLESLMGSTWVHASGNVKISNSEIAAKTDASIDAESLDASDLRMKGKRSQLTAKRDARVDHSSFQTTQRSDIAIGGDADLSRNRFLAPYTGISSKNAYLRDNEGDGDLAVQARQTMHSHNTSVEGGFAIDVRDARLSEKTKAKILRVDAEERLTNTGAINVTEDMILRGDDVEQLGTTHTGKDSYTQARKSYRDLADSKDHAGEKNILDAPNIRRFDGRRTAGKMAYVKTR